MTSLDEVKVAPAASNHVSGQPPAAAPSVSGPSASGMSDIQAQVPDTPKARALADTQLAKPYAIALATRSYQTSIAPPDVQVPAESTLGRWRTQLDAAFKSLGFLSWAKEQGLDIKSLKLDPFLGELTGLVNGKMHTFSLKDDSSWSDVSRVLLSIAKAIAPMPGQAFNYPWPDGKVPLYTVGRFYGEPIDLSPSKAISHREKLRAGAAFEFAPVSHGAQRSIAALEEQVKALGDDADRHALIAALRSQKDDAEGKIDLNNVTVPIDRRSSLFLTEQRLKINVSQLLQKYGYELPGTSTQAHDLANVLSFDLAHRMPGVDAGGVRHIAGLMSKTDLRKMKALVDQWKLKHATQAPESQNGPGVGSLLRTLVSTQGAASKKDIAGNPSLALDQLIRSPEAQALGKAIQEKIHLADSPTGATEAVTAALLQELDPDPKKSCFNLAGYNLYKSENVGASAAEIVKRFTAHLETKVGVEAAPLAAQLLLSAVAPELVVKNIPPHLVYGSHTWAEFCIAVALVEQIAPGASGNMTFSQVMNYADAQLSVLEEGGSELAAASANPLVAWGVANGVIKNNPTGQYRFEDVELSLKVLKKQKKELMWARAELMKPPPTREEVALAEFKRVFPDIDPTKETLRSIPDASYLVSPLDVYMTEPFEPERWKPVNEKELPWTQMKSRFSELDKNINKKFSDTFEEHKKGQALAWAVQFKYQLSLLPIADQECIKRSNVTFMEVSRPFLGTELIPGLSLNPGRRPRKPTPQELKDLEGGLGVLMKVEEADGKVHYYSYFPGQGKIVKEEGVPGEQPGFDDSNYFAKGSKARVAGTYNVFTQFDATNSERDSADLKSGEKGAYFSPRSGSLATLVGKFFTKNYVHLKEQAAGETRIEKNTRANQAVNEFLLSLVPFYDGIQDSLKGNVGGAVFNLAFDILGFFLPGASAARRAFKAGKSAGSIIKRSIFASVGASAGITDMIQLPRNVERAGVLVGKGAKGLYKHADEVLPRLKGNYRSYDVTQTYKEGAIVKGFHQVESDGVLTPVVAIFKKGAWYAYSTLTNTPYGPQLAQFGVVSALTPSQKTS